MRFENMSPEDQKLVTTDFPAELEKEAAAEVAVATEMYGVGFDKLATETADEIDKLAAEDKEEEEKEEKEEKMDEEGEKRASDLSSFIERGYFDGLRKLGQDRHGDENAYLYPFIQQKLAADGKTEAAKSIGMKMKALFGKARAGASSAKAKAMEHAHKAKAAVGDAAKKVHGYGMKGGYHAAGGAAAGAAAGEAHGRHAEGKKHGQPTG